MSTPAHYIRPPAQGMVRPNALELIRHRQQFKPVLVHDVQPEEERDVNVNNVDAQFQNAARRRNINGASSHFVRELVAKQEPTVGADKVKWAASSSMKSLRGSHADHGLARTDVKYRCATATRQREIAQGIDISIDTVYGNKPVNFQICAASRCQLTMNAEFLGQCGSRHRPECRQDGDELAETATQGRQNEADRGAAELFFRSRTVAAAHLCLLHFQHFFEQ
jgi:hypothetical protein